MPIKQTGFNALSPQQQVEHRAKIGVRVQAILNQFWRDESTPDAVQALEIEGWIDVLERCSHSEIRMAWAEYQRTGPRTERGTLCKPDAGALHRIIRRSRPKPVYTFNEYEPRPREERITKEEARAILEEYGYLRPAGHHLHLVSEATQPANE
jgi:hypothetical protein